jgi:hypothetical protein
VAERPDAKIIVPLGRILLYIGGTGSLASQLSTFTRNWSGSMNSAFCQGGIGSALPRFLT